MWKVCFLAPEGRYCSVYFNWQPAGWYFLCLAVGLFHMTIGWICHSQLHVQIAGVYSLQTYVYLLHLTWCTTFFSVDSFWLMKLCSQRCKPDIIHGGQLCSVLAIGDVTMYIGWVCWSILIHLWTWGICQICLDQTKSILVATSKQNHTSNCRHMKTKQLRQYSDRDPTGEGVQCRGYE